MTEMHRLYPISHSLYCGRARAYLIKQGGWPRINPPQESGPQGGWLSPWVMPNFLFAGRP